MHFVIGTRSGTRGIGVLTIEGDTTVVTSSFCVADASGCRAAVYQKGGEVVVWGNGDNNNALRSNFGYNGSGTGN